MIELPDVNSREVKLIYLVANTPYYLYRRLRSTNTVEVLAQRYSAVELVSFIKSVDADEKRYMDQAALAYAAAVALTRHSDSAGVDQALGGQEAFSGLPWISEILRVWRAGRVGLYSASVSVSMAQVTRQDRNSAATTPLSECGQFGVRLIREPARSTSSQLIVEEGLLE